MKLPGDFVKKLQEGLLNAFPSKAALEQMVRIRLEENLDTIAGGNNLSTIIFGLITWAESTGNLERLVDGAHAANPTNAELTSLRDDFLSLQKGTSNSDRQTANGVGMQGIWSGAVGQGRSLPPNMERLFTRIANGKVVLFLGPRVNEGCVNTEGEVFPSGADLALKLSSRFFPNEELPARLREICAYVETEVSRSDLEHFLYDTLIGFQPSESVLKQISLLRWRRIYTTNYDRLLEQAYETQARIQNLRPIYSDRHTQDFELGPDVPYVRLFGCITRLAARDSLLTLTTGDFVRFSANRRRLLDRLQDDLRENTILFLGFDLRDPDFETLFYEIQQGMDVTREFPRCYAVTSTAQPLLVSAWDSNKVTVLETDTAEFLRLAREYVHPSVAGEVRYSSHERIEDFTAKTAPKLDISAAAELLRSFDWVDDRLGYGETDHESYYRGNKPSWEIIRSKCDAERALYQQIMDDIALVDETGKPEAFQLAIITAEAGSGKSTLLMRLAYDHGCDFEGACLFHRSRRPIPLEPLEELYRAIGKRLYLYIDDAADNIGVLDLLAQRATASVLPITVVAAERKNEWNAVRERLHYVRPIEYELPYLDDAEIESVLDVLERNDYLCALADRNFEERREVFRQKADKQLLVAMREATEGEDFDKIIQDEYESIPSAIARKNYLNICALHRFGVPVRAGLLRRLSGVSFNDFERELLTPCERVIIPEFDRDLEEYTYRSRHQYIAEMVCNYAFRDAETMASTYLEILEKMDLGYASDLYSFRQLVRHKNIAGALPRIEHVRLFYERALALSGGDAFVHQHFGNAEMDRGNLDEAEEHLTTALRSDPRNQAYKHSYARLLAAKAKSAVAQAQRDRLVNRAKQILSEIMQEWPTNPYAYDTFALISIDAAVQADESNKREHLTEAHEVLLNGIRRCPDKSYLQATIARVYEALGDYNSAKRSLFEAHRGDPTSARTALLLGRLLRQRDEVGAALEVVTETLKFNPGHVALNFLAAELALSIMPAEHDRIISYLKKVFDPSYIDSESNFLLAVEYFKSGRYDEAEDVFYGFRMRKQFKTERSSYAVRERLVDDHGEDIRYEGVVKVLSSFRGFIDADLLPVDIYFKPNKDLKKSLELGTRVGFSIGFNLFGAIADRIRPVH